MFQFTKVALILFSVLALSQTASVTPSPVDKENAPAERKHTNETSLEEEVKTNVPEVKSEVKSEAPKVEAPKVEAPNVQITLRSVNVAENLWRSVDEKEQLFRVIPLPEPEKTEVKPDEKPCDLHQHPEQVDPKMVAMQYRNELLRKSALRSIPISPNMMSQRRARFFWNWLFGNNYYDDYGPMYPPPMEPYPIYPPPGPMYPGPPEPYYR